MRIALCNEVIAPMPFPRQCEYAAKLGYDGFFTAETQYDPFLPLALASVAEPGLDLATDAWLAAVQATSPASMLRWQTRMAIPATGATGNPRASPSSGAPAIRRPITA